MICTTAIIAVTVASGMPKQKNAHVLPGVYQLIEARNGKTSCWGIVIQLGSMQFAESIDSDQLSIIEAKHNSDVKSIMEWGIDETRKKLTIKFKKGMGDFGGGDEVTVIVDGLAFATHPLQKFVFSISTDPL